MRSGAVTDCPGTRHSQSATDEATGTEKLSRTPDDVAW